MQPLLPFRFKTALIALCAMGLVAAQCSPPVLTISEAPRYDYGETPVGTSKSKTFIVTNSGGFDAILGDVNSSGLGLSPPFALAGGSCATGLSVPVAGTCTLDVQFSPTIEGVSAGTITLRYNWSNSNRNDLIASRLIVGNLGTPVTFSGLTTNGAPVNTYTENGITVTTVSAEWTALTSYGNPAPSLIFRSPAGVATDGEIRVTADGGPFLFSAVDFYSSTTPIPFVVEGMLNSQSVFSVSDTLPNTFGRFVTFYNPRSSDVIDTLVIRMSNGTACCSNPMGVDNIFIRRPTLP